MVDVAQLVRVPDCDSGCCRFESGHPPEKDLASAGSFFIRVFRGIFFDFFDKGGMPPPRRHCVATYPRA